MTAAVITGASSGIGLELARLLAAEHYDLFLVARRREVLQRLAGELETAHHVKAVAVVADLNDAAGPARVADTVAAAGAEVAVLVNNAGFGLLGPFAETPLELDLEMVRVNVSSLTELTWRFLPGMLQRRKGMILNVASTAAFQPGPLMSVYYASKAYVLSFSLALSVELQGTGVTSTVLCPGPTRTAFQEVAGMQGVRMDRYAMDAATVARDGYRAMRRGDSIVTPGALNKLLALGTRVTPRIWTARIAKWLQEKRSER